MPRAVSCGNQPVRNRHRHAGEQALRWMSRRTTQVHSELKGASGTPGYMAPEMLRREVYDHRVDYFSLGCMVVEFVVGVCPFRTRDAAHWGGRKKKKKKKKEGVDRALLKQAKKEDARANMARAALEMAPDLTQDVWKEGLGPAAKAFCKALLHKDPSKRLGSNGVKDILDHAFFGGLDLDEVLADAVEPPFAPGKAINAKDAESIGDFASLGDDVPLSDGDFDTERWNYVSPDAYQAEVVWLLQWEEEKRGGPRKRVEMVAEKASSACAIS